MLQHKQEYRDDQEEVPFPEEEIETRYLYIYEEDPEMHHWHWPRLDVSRLINRVVQLFAVVLFGSFLLVPGTPVYSVHTITVPALLLPLQRVQTTVVLVPTGSKTIPATKAKGVLTVYNGSFLVQSLPAGFIVSTYDGVEVVTDETVTIPANNPPSNGMATVQAHVLLAGRQGNIPAGAINAVYGSSLYIKNLSAFTGGHDAQTVHYVTDEDKAKALDTARQQLQEQQADTQPPGLLQKPCSEIVTQNHTSLLVSWSCQYITYKVPANAQVLFARMQGNAVILTVKTVVLPS